MKFKKDFLPTKVFKFNNIQEQFRSLGRKVSVILYVTSYILYSHIDHFPANFENVNEKQIRRRIEQEYNES